MTQYNFCIVLAAGALLSGLASFQAVAGTAGAAATIVPRTTSFLAKSDRHAPGIVDSKSSGLAERLCSRATRDAAQRCPVSAHGNLGFPDDLTANLPHLRLNIILREMQNVVISGSGVASLGFLQEPWATFKITSAAADDSIPAPADAPYGLPVPAPGATWSNIPHANVLFQGIIENGCVGTPADFDLTLDSSIYRFSNNMVFGSVHLLDEVEGHGYYNFKYKIRATDESGNVSDFIFSGDADSFCTSQSSL